MRDRHHFLYALRGLIRRCTASKDSSPARPEAPCAPAQEEVIDGQPGGVPRQAISEIALVLRLCPKRGHLPKLYARLSKSVSKLYPRSTFSSRVRQ